MGKRRARCLRFSGRPIERLKATVMILVGVGAAVFAVWDGHRLVVLDQINRHHLFWSSVFADALIGGVFLVGWAAALITIGVPDIVRASNQGEPASWLVSDILRLRGLTVSGFRNRR